MQTLLLALCAVAHAAPAADLVSSLPGWTGALKSPMYSGYVEVEGMQVHYLFVECESKAPRDAPVLVWSNGGPGASSMFGLFVELGPYIMNQNSLDAQGPPTLFDNPYAWTKSGSVLIFDWPPPVGFSYCHDDPTGKGTSCGDWDDDRFSRVAYGALAAWYAKFPEFAGNDLYLTGESYAGIYIPRLAKSILEGGDASLKTRLKGFAVGDACAGNKVNCGGESPWFNLLFLYGHGQLSTKMFDKVTSTCGQKYLKQGGTAPKGCRAMLERMTAAAAGYFEYNLYDECTYDDLLSQGNGAVNDYVCGGGSALNKWILREDVREALHVPTDSLFFDGDNGEGMVYKQTEPDLMAFYRKVAQKTDLRVLVYNGDADPSINSFVAENWTVALGYDETQPWRAWTLDGCRKVGGYVTRYRQNFDYLTIRGSGHMVPQFKPAAAAAFLETWLSGEDYPVYVANCSAPSR